MNLKEAKQIEQEIKAICKKYGLWCNIEHIKKPNLVLIKFKEISISVKEEPQ